MLMSLIVFITLKYCQLQIDQFITSIETNKINIESILNEHETMNKNIKFVFQSVQYWIILKFVLFLIYT